MYRIAIAYILAGISVLPLRMIGQPNKPLAQEASPAATDSVPPEAATSTKGPHKLTDLCGHTDLFSEAKGHDGIVTGQFASTWQKGFPLLVLDLPGRRLYWASSSSSGLKEIFYQGFTPRVSTTDNVLVLICKSLPGDGAGINATSVVVNAPDALVGFDAGPKYIDRLFLLDAAKGSDITTVNFVGPTAPKGRVRDDYQNLAYKSQIMQDEAAIAKDKATFETDKADTQGGGSDKKKAKLDADRAAVDADTAKEAADEAAAESTERVTDTIATVLIERHKIIHFSAGGGLLLTEGSGSAVSIISAPTTTTTTTTVNTTVTTSGATSGTTQSTTQAITTGTASYAYSVRSSRPQVNGIAGLTWYPFGHDTFPVSKSKGYAVTYSSYSWAQSFGLFFGTSVSSLGNFTVAPAMEIRPGIQLFAGSTWYSKSYLPSNVVACTGYGTSPIYQSVPPTTSTQTVTAAGPPPTVMATTTTVSIATSNGCANGNLATPLAGSTLPTQSRYVPAFAFGFVFNTNLFKAFSGIK